MQYFNLSYFSSESVDNKTCTSLNWRILLTEWDTAVVWDSSICNEAAGHIALSQHFHENLCPCVESNFTTYSENNT